RTYRCRKAAAAGLHRELHQGSAEDRSAYLDADAGDERPQHSNADRLFDQNQRAGEEVMRHQSLLLGGIVLATLAFSAVEPASAADTKIERVYGTYCVQCHGLRRNGTGVNLPALSVKPR